MTATPTWREPSATTADARIAGELAAELRTMASWLGLDEVVAAERGDLSSELSRALEHAA